MTHLDYRMSRLLDTIGPMLGFRRGRAHYYKTIIVPLAVSEWLDRQAAANPAVADIIATYRRDSAQATEDHRHRIDERRRQARADRHAAGLGAPVDDGLVVGQIPDHSGASSNWKDQTETLLDLARAGRRDEFMELASMVGVASPDRGPLRTTPAAFYESTRQKLGLGRE